MANTFEKNEALKTIRTGWQGNEVRNGKFVNQGTIFLPSMTNVIKWQTMVNPQKAEKQQDTWRPAVIENTDFLRGSDDVIVWLGHATFFMRLNGISLLTDPLFFGMPMVNRLAGLPCAPEHFTGLDYILLSHGHRDHCDEKSLRLLCKNNTLQILAPLRMGGLLKKWFPHLRVQEAGWYQQYQPGKQEIEVWMLPAYHWHRRGLNDVNRILWGSFMIKTPSHLIYFGGDSSYKPHFKEIGELFPGIDIALIGVGAYSPAFMMQQSHTNPQEAIQAFHDLGAKTLIPMHYGTYDLADEPVGEPYRLLKKAEAENQIRGKLKTLSIGETYPLKMQ